MSNRNFSMNEYWIRKAEQIKPQYKFDYEKNDWEEWHTKAFDSLINTLGDFPKKVPLDPLIEYTVEQGGLIRQRVIINSEEFMSIPCIVLYPKDMKKNKKNPAILCCHGHGSFGKDTVAGIRSSEGHIAAIKNHNYNYGELMARKGFMTICPDLRGFGERSDGDNPFPGRDSCNVNFIKGALMGLYPLTLNIFDMMRCIDYLETRDEIDSNRIGMMGLSQGGTMTAFVAAIDKRIKAADIICYVNPFKEFAIKRGNFCGSQMIPELYKYLDTSDVAGLIAPRPLLIEIGIYDNGFYLQDTIKGYDEVYQIYMASGNPSKLYQDICEIGHAFCNNKAYEFFSEWL